MTLDFVKELLYPGEEGEITVKPAAMNVDASMLSVLDFSYPESVDKMFMIRRDYAEKRLESLVLKMINHAAENYDPNELLILREFYGIHRHRLSEVEIMKNYHIESVEKVTESIKSSMSFLRYCRVLEPWLYLLTSALFLPAESWRLFMRRLRSCARNWDRAEDCWECDGVLGLYRWIINED